jgi:tetratricopeptide (TPR) repeat protein
MEDDTTDAISTSLKRANDELESGHYEEAIIWYSKILEKDPYRVDCLISMGHCLYYNLNRPAEALVLMDRLLTNDPGNNEALVLKSYCLFELNDFFGSKQCIEEILRKDPSDLFGLVGMGKIHFKRYDFEKAIEYFNKALEIQPEYTSALNLKAYCLATMNKPEMALSLINKAIETEGKDYDPAHLDTKAFILYKLRKYDEALLLLEKVIEKHPHLDEAFYHKGDIHYNKKEYDDALRCYDEAIRIKPRLAEAYNAKAVVLAEMGQYQKAVDEAKNAIQIDPALSSAHENMIKIMLRIKNESKSFGSYWLKPKKRLLIPILLGVLGSILVVYSLYNGYEKKEINDEIINGTKSTTINTIKENKIHENYLIVLGLILFIILIPEIKAAKVGPVELDLSKDPYPIG